MGIRPMTTVDDGARGYLEAHKNMGLFGTREHVTYVNRTAESRVSCRLHVIWCNMYLVYLDRLHVIFDI